MEKLISNPTVSINMEPEPVNIEIPNQNVEKTEMDNYLPNALKNEDENVKNAILALKKLQVEYINEEVNYYKELQQLQMKYVSIYDPFFKKRSEIINNSGNISINECIKDFPFKETSENNLKNKNGNDKYQDDKTTGGIPDFWLNVFLNSSMLSQVIQKHDEPILKYLKDLILKYNSENRMDFTLEFHFQPNEYFSNTILTKEYYVECEVDPEVLYDFYGPEIVGCKGCKIEWKDGKNVTSLVCNEKNLAYLKDSFFNFFNPPDVDKNSETDEDTEVILEDHYEIGEHIKEKIIPRAVLYFTREISDESDSCDESQSSEDSDAPDESESSEKSQV